MRAAIRKSSRYKRSRPKGMAVVLVLGMLAITLALSYSLMRTQATTAALHKNYSRSGDARAAAEAGLSAALRSMHAANWAGVDSTLHAAVDTHAWYDVSYTTGDASLTSSSADWQEFPFRVTIHVTGTSEDAQLPGVQTKFKIEVVTQLVRRAFSADPANWNGLQNYSLLQWSTEDVSIELPFRAEGNTWLQGKLKLAENYPPSSQRNRYFSDLNLMRLVGLGDHRPFGGSLTYNASRQSSGTASTLTTLGMAPVHNSSTSVQPVAPPTSLSSYQLYPGGKLYAVPSLQQTYGYVLANATLSPNPATNPIGVFRSDSWFTLSNNAKITGTIVSLGSSNDLYVYGAGVEVNGYNLPPLDDSSTVQQLPAVMVRDDMFIYGGTTSSFNGMLLVWDDVSLPSGEAATRFNVGGKLWSSNFTVGKRDEWDMNSGQWNSSLSSFNSQWPATFYYPQWLKSRNNLNYQPLITVKPATTVVQHHWQDWTQPIYVKAAGDTGLRWDVLSRRNLP